MDESYHCGQVENTNSNNFKRDLGEKGQNKCFHSRKIFSYIDSDNSASDTFLKNHITFCSSCQKEMAKVLEIQRVIKKHIPRPEVLKEFEAQFSNEIRDIFKDYKKYTLKRTPGFFAPLKELLRFN